MHLPLKAMGITSDVRGRSPQMLCHGCVKSWILDEAAAMSATKMWGVPWPWGYPHSWMVYLMENPIYI